jgi:hypothetical protein
MHAVYDLKEMLCKELEDYGKKGELSAGSLDIVDKLAHTIKNLDKIIESYEEEESRGSYNYGGNMPYRGGSYEDGRSYARGRGSNARRDSMGRYSREGYSRADEMVDKLRDLMNDAPDDRTRQEIQRLVTKMEQM